MGMVTPNSIDTRELIAALLDIPWHSHMGVPILMQKKSPLRGILHSGVYQPRRAAKHSLQ